MCVCLCDRHWSLHGARSAVRDLTVGFPYTDTVQLSRLNCSLYLYHYISVRVLYVSVRRMHLHSAVLAEWYHNSYSTTVPYQVPVLRYDVTVMHMIVLYSMGYLSMFILPYCRYISLPVVQSASSQARRDNILPARTLGSVCGGVMPWTRKLRTSL